MMKRMSLRGKQQRSNPGIPSYLRMVILSLGLYLFPLPVSSSLPSQPASAISRYGSPKYAENFQAFGYVNPKAPKGGELRLNMVGTFDSLNKDTIKGTEAQGLLLTLDPLMKRSADEPFTLYGVIAEKAAIALDNSSITFYLNPKARFHDGTSITAEDIKFTFELLAKEGLHSQRRYYSQIESIDILEAEKGILRITLKKPEGTQEYDPELPFLMALIRPLSKASLEGKSFTETGLTPILGTGPYRICHVDPGHMIIYERVKDYWAAELPVNRGQGNFDSIKVEYFKNAQTQFQAFLTGQSDFFAETDLQQWHTAYNVPAVMSGKIKRFSPEHKRPVTVYTLIFNMRNPLFQDPRVRQALVRVFDFSTLNRLYFHNAYKPMTSLFANTVLAHSGPAKGKELEILLPYKDQLPAEIMEKGFTLPSLSNPGDFAQNKLVANKLLTEAGWIVKNGVRINAKTGKPLTFTIQIKDPKFEKIVNLYKKNLEEMLSIRITVARLETLHYEAMAKDFKFDALIHCWSNSLSPGNEQAYYFSAKAADSPGSSNYIGVKNPSIEAIAQNVSKAKSYDELVEAVHALDRMVMGHYYFVPLFYDNVLRWAFWQERINMPEFDPIVGLNILEWGWSKQAEAVG